MKVDFKLDDREFKRALQEYYRETQKDLSYVVNRAALNVSIKASQNTPIAEAKAIRALPKTLSYWPKIVAARLSKKGPYNRKQAREKSKAMIRQRISTVRWLRSGWRPAMKLFSALKLGSRGGTKGTKQFQGDHGSAIAARPGINPTAMIANKAPTDGRSLAIVRNALQKALNLAALDMRQYIAKKMGATAKKYSAK